MKIKFIYLFLFFCLFIKAQIIELDSIKTDYFKKYNIVFLGEQHKILSTDNVETKLVSMINTNNTKILLETPYDANYVFEKFFIEKDTVNYKFFSHKYNPYHKKLFKYLDSINKYLIASGLDIDELDKIYLKLIILLLFTIKTEIKNVWVYNDWKKLLKNIAIKK